MYCTWSVQSFVITECANMFCVLIVPHSTFHCSCQTPLDIISSLGAKTEPDSCAGYPWPFLFQPFSYPFLLRQLHLEATKMQTINFFFLLFTFLHFSLVG